MSAAPNTTVFITGSNRGIGLGLVRQYLSRPNTTVIAGVRNPEKATELKASQKHANNTRLIVVKVDSSDNGSPAAAAAGLQKFHHINSVDIVIANAGTIIWKPVHETEPTELLNILQVNVVGILNLYQALLPLLRNSSSRQGPIFTCISSLAGSLTILPDATAFTNAAYGASKAAVNYIVTKLALEAPLAVEKGGHGLSNLTAFVMNPGMVSSDMGHEAASILDIRVSQMLTPEESASKMTNIIDNATREKNNAKFFGVDGEELPW